MATTVKKKVRTRDSALAEQPVLYRGVKIAPMTGVRSALAEDIRDGLRAKKAEQSRGEPTRA